MKMNFKFKKRRKKEGLIAKQTKCKINNFRFKCPYNECDKKYGCEISLNLHIKIKHNGGTKT